MASCDLKLDNIISKFSNVADLTHWAIENDCLNNAQILSRLEYLISIENTINSFHDSKQLLEWSLDNKVFNLSIVRTRIAYLNNLEQYDETSKKHDETSQKQSQILCEQCKRKFNGSLSYRRHKCSTRHFCVECNGYFVNIENHSKIHTQNYEPKEINCRKCNTSFPDRKKLYMHTMTEHMTGGADNLQPVPFNINPWENLDDGSVDEDLREVYEAHSHIILANHEESDLRTIYNFPLNNSFTLETLKNQTVEIYNSEEYAFRINVAFGIILQNIITGEYRFFRPYMNNLLPELFYIHKREDLEKIYNRFESIDIQYFITGAPQDTKWRPALLTNARWYVYKLPRFRLGNGKNISQYLKKKRCVISLEKSYNGTKLYKDNLCIFRCLAYHRHSFLYKQNETLFHEKTVEYENEFKSFIKCTETKFDGFETKNIPFFEDCFKINVNIFCLQEDDIARAVYKSLGRFKDTMYVNINNDHLSYITNINTFSSKYACIKCDKLFKTKFHLARHNSSCDNRNNLKFLGGFYSPTKTIFEKLELNDFHVEKRDRFFEWFIVYDFEALLLKTNTVSTKTVWTNKHIPVSVSINSNVFGYDKPFCIVNVDEDQLISDMLSYMIEISDQVKIKAKEKWSYIFQQINDKITSYKDLNENEASEDSYSPNKNLNENEASEDSYSPNVAILKNLNELNDSFELYCSQIPVIGFNSAKYDINLIKRKLLSQLELYKCKNAFIVKRNNAYTCVANKQLRFIDITQYLAQGFNYRQFLTAYKVKEEKSYFPYEWFDDIEKLDCIELPNYDCFFSTLKNTNVLSEEIDKWNGIGEQPKCGKDNYNDLLNIWKTENMKTFKDFLIYYNNKDVGPFVKAIENMQKFYIENELDIFKNAISLPGVARRMLFEESKHFGSVFSLFDKNNKEFYECLKRNIVGGPSIIFKRYHKTDETKIRDVKLCKSIVGFDANALYLWCFSQNMPTGSFIKREHPKFIPIRTDKHMNMYYWMDYNNKTNNLRILHKLNNGKEKRIGPYYVDGIDLKSNIVYEYNGCYYHGHDCIKNDKEGKSKLLRTNKRIAYIESLGFKTVQIWECEFLKECRTNTDLQNFINSKQPKFSEKYKHSVTEKQIIQGVLNDDLFGMIEVDLHVPADKYEYFSEFSPIFCNTNVSFEDIGSHMQDHCLNFNLGKRPRRLLIGGMKAEKILLATDLLKWYITHGLIISHIYTVIEYTPQKCFTNFVSKVSNARRAGDKDKTMAIIAETMKLIGNSAYGSTIMNKEKHLSIKYVEGDNKVPIYINDPRFRNLTKLDDSFYEIERYKRRIVMDIPIQIGFIILQYAKLRMLGFYYDCIDKYINRNDFELIQMDTDSLYFGLASESFVEAIKPSMVQEYTKQINACNILENNFYHNTWFPRTCCSDHILFDKRTPGLFKQEFFGNEMVALCSKTYIINNDEKYKFSCKGINKQNLTNISDIYRNVLTTQEAHSSLNTGFRLKNNSIFTYKVLRCGFTYFYCKRVVLDDGITTVPLNIMLKP